MFLGTPTTTGGTASVLPDGRVGVRSDADSLESLSCNARGAALDEPIEWTSEATCSPTCGPRK